MKSLKNLLPRTISCCLCILLLAGCTSTKPPVASPTTDPKATATPTEQPADIDAATVNYSTQTWVALEIPFESSVEYVKAPIYTVDFDVSFTAPDGTVLVMPGFWDGGNTWKVRFAPTMYGVWKYKTTCTDTANIGLNGKEGTIACNAYKGELDIYKHGFLKTGSNGRYFTHADGTPFFYLGDTHWFLGNEKFETSNQDGIASQFKYSVDLREGQGFTVYQSEPLFNSGSGVGREKTYNLATFDKNDLAGFANFDRKFQYIAQKGLVHANAQLFFVSDLLNNKAYTEDYLKKLTRYWVARYGAYPVMWTTAQEVDDSFYDKLPSPNPWIAVTKQLAASDPYKQPLSAHTEGAGGVKGKTSVFNPVQGHSWFALQIYSNYYNDIVKSFWSLPNPKPIVNYESGYEQIDVKQDAKFIRTAAYRGFLSGMFGYGYGAHGVWNDIYSKQDSGPQYLDTAGRLIFWYEGTQFEGGKQLTHLKSFFSALPWYELTPDLGYNICIQANTLDYAASNIKNDLYIAFFFSEDTNTGSFKAMDPGAMYNAKWFNPRTGEYIEIGQVQADADKRWQIPDRPDTQDWLVVVTKQ